ncbi:protein TIFY 6B isoform X2 [Carya illinoinensis]|uniref:protein TIFY 6B isoform X2 n=1 Tax=Carya illinoinensis TaxID=32201 RepID=UPI001C727CB0|nr:protein TIFY 6B isoform X2 [Carya illinoinensis]
MERDFLGLTSKNVSVNMEANEDSNNSELRRSGMQWPFSNKISAGPQFLSFRATQEDHSPRKTLHDPLASSGSMTISSADVLDTNQKPYSGVIQKNLSFDKQVENQYAMKVYPLQHHDAYSIHRSRKVRVFPVSNQQNQTSTVALGTTVLQSHQVSTGQNMVGSTIKPKPHRVTAPVSVLPSTGSVVGTTDLRNGSKFSGAPAQLTVFYAGSVSVYDDITPERALAIMLLGGNGSSTADDMTLSTTQEPSPFDGMIKNRSHTTTLFPGPPNPLSFPSQACSQLGVGASGTNESERVKPMETSSESHKVFSLAEHAGTTLIPTVGLPQARKASLARFLEKRKERVMHISPYNVSKQSPGCSTPRSDTGSSQPTSMN